MGKTQECAVFHAGMGVPAVRVDVFLSGCSCADVQTRIAFGWLSEEIQFPKDAGGCLVGFIKCQNQVAP